MEDGMNALGSIENYKLQIAATEDVMDDAQSMVSMDSCGKAGTLGASSVLITEELSIESIQGEANRHRHLSINENVIQEALQGDCLDGNKILCEVTENDDSSHIASADEDALQGHSIKRNTVACGVMGDDELSNFASKDTCTDTKTLVEQSCLILNTKNNGEENHYQHNDFVSPSGNEEKKHTRDDLSCCEAISNQEKISCIYVETESHDKVDDSLSNDKLIESHNPNVETGGLGQAKEYKAGVKIPLLKASDKAQCQCLVSDVTDCRGTFSHYENCDQGKFSLENEDSEAGDSFSPAVCVKPEAIQDEDAKHDLSALMENTSACMKASDSSGDLNALLLQDNEEHASDSCIPRRFSNIEDKGFSIAQVSEIAVLESRQDVCEEIPQEASMELKGTAINVKSEDDITNETLEDLTCFSDTAKISNLELNESAGDEECLLAGGQEPSVKCSSWSPSIRFSVAQVRDVGDNSLQCSESNKLEDMDFGIGQTKEGTASNKSQIYGYTIDKDGGSSMDSTAGTEWKPQGTDGRVTAEDEETSNTGGEDSASSPAHLQPSMHQRKKININHQFVREIVKIQHDREQYDREQTERQIQAQQAVASALRGGKSSDPKGHKIHSLDSKQPRSEFNKISSQKGVKDHGDDRQMDSQQKHATGNNKSLSVQGKEGSSHQKNAQENSEPGRQIFLQGGAKEHGKTGRGRQQRSISIYRPPVVRDALTARELETSYHQSGTCVVNSSHDSSTSSVSEFHAPIVGSPNMFDDEGTFKVARSSSGGSYAHNREPQAEQCKPGMGIKVTFDTERKLRHIEFSDLPKGHQRTDQVSLVSSHRSSGFGMSKSPIINPLLSHRSQEPRSSHIDKRQAAIGETSSKANDHYFIQADRSSSLQGSSPSESSQFGGKMGKASDNHIERKNSFFEQADNTVSLHNSSAWSHKSPSLAHHGNNGLSGSNIYIDNIRHAGGLSGNTRTQSALSQGTRNSSSSGPSYKEEPLGEGLAGYMRMQSASSQGFNTPSSRKSTSSGPSYKGEPLDATSHSSPYMRSDEPGRTPGNFQASLQAQQLNISRSKHDLKGKQRLAISDGSQKKRDLQLQNSIKDSGSPFQAIIKDTNRPQVLYSSRATPSSDDGRLDIQGFGMRWDMDDLLPACNQDSSYEGLKRTQSDTSRKGSTQNLQAQSSPLPSRESFFSTMPMQEKWGDIVDDQYDSFDFLQVKHEEERESHPGSLSYGSITQSSAAFVDAASLKSKKETIRDSKQNRMLRKSGHSETGSSQRNKAASELLQDHSAYETPVRKSVFERLGPQNNFKESILGPPPKVLDSRGVLRATPDIIISNASPVNTFKSFDSGYHASQQAGRLSGMLHDTGENINGEGREVVVQAYTEFKQRRSRRELYVPRRGS